MGLTAHFLLEGNLRSASKPHFAREDEDLPSAFIRGKSSEIDGSLAASVAITSAGCFSVGGSLNILPACLKIGHVGVQRSGCFAN